MFSSSRPGLEVLSKGDLLSTSAAFVDELLATAKPSQREGHDEALEALADKDKDKGFASGPLSLSLSREYLDYKYGHNKWRPLPRFAIFQAHNNKWRPIDDGRRSSHNKSHIPWRKVHTTSLRFIAVVGRFFLQFLPLLRDAILALPILLPELDSFPSLLFEGGTDDEKLSLPLEVCLW